MGEMRAFHFKCTKQLISNLLVYWELVTGRLSRQTCEMLTFQVMCALLTHFNEIERPLPRMVILYL